MKRACCNLKSGTKEKDAMGQSSHGGAQYQGKVMGKEGMGDVTLTFCPSWSHGL